MQQKQKSEDRKGNHNQLNVVKHTSLFLSTLFILWGCFVRSAVSCIYILQFFPGQFCQSVNMSYVCRFPVRHLKLREES